MRKPRERGLRYVDLLQPPETDPNKQPPYRALQLEYQRVVRLVGGIPTQTTFLMHTLHRTAALLSVKKRFRERLIRDELIPERLKCIERFWTSTRMAQLSKAAQQYASTELRQTYGDCIPLQEDACPFMEFRRMLIEAPGRDAQRDALIKEWETECNQLRLLQIRFIPQLITILHCSNLNLVDRAEIERDLREWEEAKGDHHRLPRIFQVSISASFESVLLYLFGVSTPSFWIDHALCGANIPALLWEGRLDPQAVITTSSERTLSQEGWNKLRTLQELGPSSQGLLLVSDGLRSLEGFSIHLREAYLRFLEALHLDPFEPAEMAIPALVYIGSAPVEGMYYLYRSTVSRPFALSVAVIDGARLSPRLHVFMGTMEQAAIWIESNRGEKLRHEPIIKDKAKLNPFSCFHRTIEAHLRLRRQTNNFLKGKKVT